MLRSESGAAARGVLWACALALLCATAWAVHDAPASPGSDQAAAEKSLGGKSSNDKPTPEPEDVSLRQALVSLPFAAVLGAALAFRPRRRGTPARSANVIQTQIILTVVGALVMLVVGASLARAFGIVGAANLVRYRSKIDDPKDAGVMLCCLALGLATGVGIYWVALVSTLFILLVLWVLESIEPARHKDFLLAIKAADPARFQARIEEILRRHHTRFELRTSSKEDLTYSAVLPLNKRTDQITSAILALGGKQEIAVEWSERKPVKNEA